MKISEVFKKKAEEVDLTFSCKNCDIKLLKEALKKGANIDTPIVSIEFDCSEEPIVLAKDNILTYAIKCGKSKNTKQKINYIAELLKNNIDLNFFDEDKNDALTLAFHGIDQSKELSLTLIKMLFNAGADPNNQNSDKNSPFHIFCANVLSNHKYSTVTDKIDKKILQLFLKNKVNINLYNRQKCTPFCYACNTGRADFIEILFKNGADLNPDCEFKYTPLSMAGRRTITPGFKIVEFLLENGADPERVDTENWDIKNKKLLDLSLIKRLNEQSSQEFDL